jgi:RNA 3'-terminal phosphate cyclase (ATP)
MIVIDVARGEGGGQILRTALGLSLVTGRPFRIRDIRARRRRPGLLPQHRTAVEAAACVAAARTSGVSPGSRELTFEPTDLVACDLDLDVGTAGSTTLVLQAILPGLLRAPGPSRIRLEGGTHNPGAPPVEFLERVFLPWLRRMGAQVELRLVRHGFFPAGGGILEAEVQPTPSLAPLEILERGRVVRRSARAVVAQLAPSIAERELEEVRRNLGWRKKERRVEVVEETDSPGNLLLLEVECEHATELITGFGEIRVPAERVAQRAVRELERYLRAGVPIGSHLADQLMVPLALAGGGAYVTLPLSDHARANAEVVERFCAVRIETRMERKGVERVDISGESP